MDGLPNVLGVILLAQSPNGADVDTLAAKGACCLSQFIPEGRPDVGIEPAFLRRKRTDLLNLLTDRHAPPAQDAFARIPSDGRSRIINPRLRFLSLETNFANPHFFSQPLKLTLQVPCASQAFLRMGGKE